MTTANSDLLLNDIKTVASTSSRRCSLRAALAIIPIFIITLILFQEQLTPFLLSSISPFAQSSTTLFPPLFRQCQLLKDQNGTQTTTIGERQIPDSFSDVIKSYIKWHRQKRKCMLQGTCSNTQVLVWSCPTNSGHQCNGLGDRFRGIQLALLIAIVTKRVFLIHWPANANLASHLPPNLIDWQVPPDIDTRKLPFLRWYECFNPNCVNYKKKVNWRNLPPPDFIGTPINMYKDDIRAVLQKHDILALSQFYGPGLAAGMRVNPHISSQLGDLYAGAHSKVWIERMMLYTLFRKSDTLVRRMCNNNPPERYYAVHIRAGMDMHEPMSRRFGYMKKHKEETVQQLWQCVRSLSWDEHAIYLASDSKELKTMFVEVLKANNVTVFEGTEKGAMHVAKGYAAQARSRNESFALEQDVYVDLMFLAGSESIAMTSSGFASRAFTFGNGASLYRVKVEKGSKDQCKKALEGVGYGK